MTDSKSSLRLDLVPPRSAGAGPANVSAQFVAAPQHGNHIYTVTRAGASLGFEFHANRARAHIGARHRARQIRFPNVTWPRGPALIALLVLYLFAGCRGCARAGGLAVGGEHPYTRCLAGDPPGADKRKVGALTLHLDKRALRIDGLPGEPTLAAFAGPGSGSPPSDLEVAALRSAKPDLVLLVGDVGDDAKTASATLAALAKLQVPVLVLASGRDTPARIADALDQLPPVDAARIIPVTGLRTIQIGRDTLVPVAGAPDGHYALSAEACGYGASDLDDVASALAEATKSRRWLLAWAAPASPGRFAVGRTETGPDLGNAALAKLGERIGAQGGIFAWPHVQAGRASASAGSHRPSPGLPSPDLQLVVPRISGQALERSDGSRLAPGFAVLKLDEGGLKLVELRSTHP
jgi:hypothetical protein